MLQVGWTAKEDQRRGGHTSTGERKKINSSKLLSSILRNRLHPPPRKMVKGNRIKPSQPRGRAPKLNSKMVISSWRSKVLMKEGSCLRWQGIKLEKWSSSNQFHRACRILVWTHGKRRIRIRSKQKIQKLMQISKKTPNCSLTNNSSRWTSSW